MDFLGVFVPATCRLFVFFALIFKRLGFFVGRGRREIRGSIAGDNRRGGVRRRGGVGANASDRARGGNGGEGDDGKETTSGVLLMFSSKRDKATIQLVFIFVLSNSSSVVGPISIHKVNTFPSIQAQYIR